MFSEFSDSKRLSSYTGSFLYSSYVRSTLQSINITRSDELFDCAIMVDRSFSYANTCCLDLDEDFDEEKAELFSYATFLSYIPYGKAGYDYIQNKLGNKPVWEYQYENALNTLTLDNAYLTDTEKEELKEYFRLLYQNKYKLDFTGFVSIIVKCRILCYLNHDRNDTQYFTSIFELFEGDLDREIDISEYLPERKEIDLTEAEIEELEYVFKTQQNRRAHIRNLSREQFSNLLHQRPEVIEGDGTESVGDVIHFLWDSIYIVGEIIEIVNKLDGGAPLLKFKLDKASHHSFGPYTVEFDEQYLENAQKNDDVMIILKDTVLYDSLYAYDRFVLKDERTGKEILVSCGYPTCQLMSNKQKLLDYISKYNFPLANLTMDEVLALTDDDFLLGIYAVKGSINEIQ